MKNLSLSDFIINKHILAINRSGCVIWWNAWNLP